MCPCQHILCHGYAPDLGAICSGSVMDMLSKCTRLAAYALASDKTVGWIRTLPLHLRHPTPHLPPYQQANIGNLSKSIASSLRPHKANHEFLIAFQTLPGNDASVRLGGGGQARGQRGWSAMIYAHIQGALHCLADKWMPAHVCIHVLCVYKTREGAKACPCSIFL